MSANILKQSLHCTRMANASLWNIVIMVADVFHKCSANSFATLPVYVLLSFAAVHISSSLPTLCSAFFLIDSEEEEDIDVGYSHLISEMS